VKPRRHSGIELELVESRPQPPETLVRSIVARAERRTHRLPIPRLAFAGAFSASILLVLGVTGGFGAAGSAVSSLGKAVAHIAGAKITRTPSSSSAGVQYEEPPSIDGFSPRQGPRGSRVVIRGTNLGQLTDVRFGRFSADFAILSDTRVRARVPRRAVTNRISVSNEAGTDTSARKFVVILEPVISSFSPRRGPVGTKVTIRGDHFTGVDTVEIGSRDMAFDLDSDNKITAKVPRRALDGKIRVMNEAGSDTTVSKFTVSR
jgi:hypothetical protein